MQIIYCFVEEQGKELQDFIEKYDESNILHIYSSVIDSCEGDLFYCIGEIINNCMPSTEKLWLVTDVKRLYDIAERLCNSLFDKIIYIEQNVDNMFKEEFDVTGIIEYFLNIQKSKLQVILMRKLWMLKDSSLQEMVQFLYEMTKMNIEKDKYAVKIWCCFCELLLYEIENIVSEENRTYYKISLYSILMHFSEEPQYTNGYLSEILLSNDISADNMYFVWNQFKRISLKGLAVFDAKSHEMCDELYDRCYNEFEKELKDYLVKIPLTERNKDLVFITTIQFLDDTHAPTKTVMERAKVLKKLGKTVVIINTTEQYTMNGYVPMYNVGYGRVLEEYDDIQQMQIGSDVFSFLQIPSEFPVTYKMQVIYHVINKLKPYYILSVGTGSMLADLCGNIVPCASMALAFSTLPHTKNRMKILGRTLCEEEKRLYVNDDIIESRFTFELERQKQKFVRADYKLPENRFILVVIGIRLQYEIQPDFIEMLQKACEAGCYVVFAGIMDNYDVLMKDYPIVSDNSSFIGFCDDVLALMEICDLYVNPARVGGGFSIIEAFIKGRPGVYLRTGDVYTAGGEDFAVENYDEMVRQIIRYKSDKEYYDKMAERAESRAKLMTSSLDAISEIDKQICKRVEEKYW